MDRLSLQVNLWTQRTNKIFLFFLTLGPIFFFFFFSYLWPLAVHIDLDSIKNVNLVLKHSTSQKQHFVKVFGDLFPTVLVVLLFSFTPELVWRIQVLLVFIRLEFLCPGLSIRLVELILGFRGIIWTQPKTT